MCHCQGKWICVPSRASYIFEIQAYISAWMGNTNGIFIITTPYNNLSFILAIIMTVHACAWASKLWTTDINYHGPASTELIIVQWFKTLH